MLLRARQFEFVFPRPALVMGVVNVTPDSFSDGGKFFDTAAAVEHGLKLATQGAEILDIGGESTRPRATAVPEQEELRRVIPVIEQLAARVKIPISIDTMKPGVARAAIAAGASIVNDIAANREDDAMWRMVADSGAGYVLMHMQGTPQTMQSHPVYGDVVQEVGEFFSDRIQRLNDCGVARDQVIVDVGIGFGKTLEHNLLLLGALRSFKKLEQPLLLGVSRKSFMGKLLGAETPERLPAALACAALAVEAGAQIIRTHDVAETVQAVRMTEAILARRK
ncbi:MAG TPA: dihydropteroate synthase [Candidatus Angelobacter sp.]|nr:dihydropteroate synthase [Candidatus Angelobacter sp.]